MEKIYLKRKMGTVIMDSEDYMRVVSEGNYITLTKIKRSYGYYLQPMVCRKSGNKLAFRMGLARYIMGAPEFKHIDHVDQDPLNNSKDNLRMCDVSQNGANRKKSSGTKYKYKGVVMRGKVWHAAIKCKKLMYRVGPFETQEHAALGYNKLAKMLFGDFAGLNNVTNK